MNQRPLSFRAFVALALAVVAVGTTVALWLSQTADSQPVHVQAAASHGVPRLVGWHFATTTTTTAPTTTTQAPPPPPTTPHRAPVAHRVTQGHSSGHWHPGGPCPSPSQCPQLRYCENGRFGYSHGDSPLFDGAYQFDHGSQWGMSPADQDARADAMYADRGADPWPTCGRYLA